VATTTRDGSAFVVPEQDVLAYSRGHAVLTTPPYPISDAVTGVHLRWYLANSLFRKHRSPAGEDKVIFLSIHADSLHPSLRGATAYVPNTAGMAGSYGRSGTVFSQRQEYREQPRVSFSLGERQKSEGRSRDLAERVIGGFRGRHLAVHPYQPVRDRIFRGRRAWVPAVLRYNAVPAKLLLEICNLANDEDRRLLQTRPFREEIAAAVVDGILAYFD
jgi:N-acetylmuramoyl-L-alanine amidase